MLTFDQYKVDQMSAQDEEGLTHSDHNFFISSAFKSDLYFILWSNICKTKDFH